MIAQNKKARYEYELLEEVDAGMVLKGAEVKSLRESKVSMGDAYCFFDKDALYIRNLYIAPYEKASDILDAYRVRKLLLKKTELKRWKKRSEEKGLSIVPTQMYFSKRGWAKVKIALAKGKKLHDKRQSIKEKEVKRHIDRTIREKTQ